MAKKKGWEISKILLKKLPQEKKMSNVSKKFLIENKFLQIWPVKQG